MQQHLSRRSGAALIWLLLLTAAPTWAQGLYQVDLIVFALTDPAARTAERWPANPGQPGTGGITTPGTSAVISPKEGSLAPEWDRLQTSARYKPLSYFRWRQPVGGAGSPSRAVVESTARTERKIPEVLGTVTLVQGETLRADVDLLYSEKGKEDASPSQFRLQETRSLREGTLNYLDHGVFGALIQVTPAH